MANFRKMVCGVLQRCTLVLGEWVEYTPRSTNRPITLRGIFDEVFIQVDPNTDAQIASNQPMLGIKMEDLPDRPRRNDIVVRTLDGVQTKYKVIDSQEDGQGGATLFLQLVTKR